MAPVGETVYFVVAALSIDVNDVKCSSAGDGRCPDTYLSKWGEAKDLLQVKSGQVNVLTSRISAAVDLSDLSRWMLRRGGEGEVEFSVLVRCGSGGTAPVGQSMR